MLDGPPLPGHLAELPAGWVAGITGGRASRAQRASVADELNGGRHTGAIPHGSRHVALVSYAGYLRRMDLPFEQAKVLMLARLARLRTAAGGALPGHRGRGHRQAPRHLHRGTRPPASPIPWSQTA
jgi:hypothetical protein